MIIMTTFWHQSLRQWFVPYVQAPIDLPLQFLGRRDTGQERLRGLLDEITIFNRALGGPEIHQLRLATRGPWV